MELTVKGRRFWAWILIFLTLGLLFLTKVHVIFLVLGFACSIVAYQNFKYANLVEVGNDLDATNFFLGIIRHDGYVGTYLDLKAKLKSNSKEILGVVISGNKTQRFLPIFDFELYYWEESLMLIKKGELAIIFLDKKKEATGIFFPLIGGNHED